MFYRRISVAQWLVGLALVAAACSSPATSSTSSTGDVAALPTPTTAPSAGVLPVIVDYSPTVSDVGALLYLLSHPDVEVIAITLPVTGEAGCELGAEVTLGILALVEQDGVPVACDEERPEGAGEWPAEFLAGRENLAFGLPDPLDGPDGRPAHQLIADAAAAADRPPILYAVAPLTNVARALDRHPGLADQLERIVVMGGAVDAPGNVPGTDAEWNLWIDVASAARVLDGEAAVTLVPLDATNDVPVPPFWEHDLGAAEQSAAITYLNTMVRTFPAVTSGFFYLWDELAAAVAAGEDLVTTEQRPLSVVVEPGPGYGSTVAGIAGSDTTVATSAPDPDRFYDHFLATLAGAPVAAPAPLVYDGVAGPPQPDAPPMDVLAYWLFRGTTGDVEAAGSVVAPDATWVGFFASPDAYVESSAPYAPYDIEVTCVADGPEARCEMTWNDKWLEAIPELELGGLTVRATVADGLITAFRDFALDADVVGAFDSHASWLAAHHSDGYAAACGSEVGAPACSELLVATVDEWVAGR